MIADIIQKRVLYVQYIHDTRDADVYPVCTYQVRTNGVSKSVSNSLAKI